MPFSDPLADGPVIHAAATAALAAGATLELGAGDLLGRRRAGPGGADGLLEHGAGRGAPRSSPAGRPQAGAAGAIVPDLPLGEAEEIGAALAAAGLASIPLVAPTTPSERRRRICEVASGFVYVVSDVGTTGERAELPAGALRARRRGQGGGRGAGRGRIRDRHAEQAAEVGEVADGVIIGSRLVRLVAEADDSTRQRSRRSPSFLGRTRDALAG